MAAGTKIFFCTGEQRMIETRPSSCLKSVIEGELRSHERPQLVFTAERRYDATQPISADAQVGRKDWTVLSESTLDVDQRLKAVEQKMDEMQASHNQETAELKASVSALKAALGPAHIRNLAAQVLLSIIEPLHLPDSNRRFRTLEEEGYRPLLDVAEQLELKPSVFALRADVVITRRNETIHRSILSDELARTRNLLDAHPELRQQYKHECQILDNYELLQATFGAD